MTSSSNDKRLPVDERHRLWVEDICKETQRWEVGQALSKIASTILQINDYLLEQQITRPAGVDSHAVETNPFVSQNAENLRDKPESPEHFQSFHESPKGDSHD